MFNEEISDFDIWPWARILFYQKFANKFILSHDYEVFMFEHLNLKGTWF